MQVLFRFHKYFLQDSGVKGFMFVNDVKVLTTFLTTTQTKSQVLFYTVHGLDFRFHRGVGVELQGQGYLGVSENFGEGAQVHSRLNSPGCEGMAKGVNAHRRQTNFLQRSV